jgi:hypothetical protein
MYVFLVGIAGSLPLVLLVLRSGQTERLDPSGNIVLSTPEWVSAVGHVAQVLLAVGALVFFVVRVLGGAQARLAPWIAIVLVVSLALSDGLQGRQVFGSEQLVLGAVLLAASVARPGRPAFLGAAACGVLLAVVSGVEALVEPTSVFHECREDKCGVLGFLFRGVFTNENIFGLLLALSIPFVWISVRGRVRIVLCLYLAFMAVVTGDRTAAIASVISLVFLSVLRPTFHDEHGTERPAGRLILAGLGISGLGLAGLLLPYLPYARASIHERVFLWELAKDHVAESPLVGFGAQAWDQFHLESQTPLSHSVHNQWLDTLYAGGLIGLGLLLVLIGYVLLSGGRDGFVLACCVLAPVLVTAATERPWSFAGYNWLSFTVVAAVLVPVRELRAGAGTLSGDRRAKGVDVNAS